MIFAKELILKGVAGLAVVGGLGAGGIYVWNQRKEESLEILIKKVGLKDCTTSGSVCTFDTQGLNLKQDSDTHKGKSKTDPQPTGSTSGKIKVYTVDKSEYNKGFKFVIEEGDISLNNSGTTTSKLEEFETYEIKEHEGTHYLTRREKSSEAKRRLLGIPNVDTCKLPENDSPVECQLDAAKLKAIKFDGKSADGEPNIDNAGNGEQINLKISKTSDAPFTVGGYKFVLETNKDITIPKSSNGNISIKKGTNTEFKIKITSAASSEGPRTLTLEKAWTAKSLGEKVGLDCPEPSGETKECTLKENGINVHNGNDKKHTGLSRGNNNNKKIKYEVDVEDYNQGFKFYVEGSDDICLQANGGQDGNDNKKIESKGNSEVTYEIKETESTWYLTKKSQAPAA